MLRERVAVGVDSSSPRTNNSIEVKLPVTVQAQKQRQADASFDTNVTLGKIGSQCLMISIDVILGRSDQGLLDFPKLRQ